MESHWPLQVVWGKLEPHIMKNEETNNSEEGNEDDKGWKFKELFG